MTKENLPASTTQTAVTETTGQPLEASQIGGQPTGDDTSMIYQ